MAAVSTLSQSRRKKTATYGKASRSVNSWTGLDALDEDELSPTKKAVEKSVAVNDVYRVQKSEAKPGALKSIKPRPKKKDTWDVPSSDEDEPSPVAKRVLPPKAPARRKLIDVQETEQKLAPWEKKRGGVVQDAPGDQNRRKKHGHATADDQLAADLARATEQNLDDAHKTIVESPPSTKRTKRETLQSEPSAKKPSPNRSSAAARLKARMQDAQSQSAADRSVTVSPPAQKRLGNVDGNEDSTPRKRPRTEKLAEVAEDLDVVMDDAPAPPSCASTPTPETQMEQKKVEKMDIFEVPDSSAEESAKAVKMKPTHRKSPKQRTSRRGIPTTYTRSSPRTMTSAPARLSEMIPTDTDTTDDTTRSPSIEQSRQATPQKAGGSSRPATPTTALKTGGAMTPKQTQLWDQLLTSDAGAVPSPSVLPMQDLTLKNRRTVKSAAAPSRTFTKSSSDVGPPRTKLVDRLKASAPSTDDESSDDSDGVENASDTDNEDHERSDAMEEVRESQHSQMQSQSQSQSTYSANTGPKLTYAQARSYLPEDSFEDQLMFDLPSLPQQRPAALARHPTTTSNAASQKSAFDFDESDDEGEGGRMRNIHELRAGGGNQRFVDSIGGLLEDIADHDVSSRSRRRSAMVELVTKLSDKTFSDKFVRQGYEQQLLAECSAVKDEIADFVLTAAFVSLLAAELPDHSIRSFSESSIVPWLVGALDELAHPKKLAKDRRNNMSKSAQTAFVDFATTFSERQAIWKDSKPGVISQRTLALKACDLLIGKLRRSGNSNDLMDVDGIRRLIPFASEIDSTEDQTSRVNIDFSISALESLSTTQLSLAWPSEAIERIRLLLVSPQLVLIKSQHLLFLTLRLCLNVTKDNARNCKGLTKEPTVSCLFRVVEEGFAKLHADSLLEDEAKINLDLLVLSISLLFNLTEHNSNAREQAVTAEASPLLSSLVDVFQQGQKRLLEAESVEQANTNVAYGYLAVMLANVCRNRDAQRIVASKLPGKNLDALVDAVAEFVKMHRSVDTMTFAGEEGVEVWSAFTEKLKDVLERLKVEAAGFQA